MATAMTLKLRRKLVKIHTSRRRNKAVIYLREEVAKHFKSDPELVRISMKLNEHMNANSTNMYKPIMINVNKDKGIVDVSLQGEQTVKTDEKKDKAKAPAQATTQQAKTAAVTTKAASDIQKQVTKDISKKVEEKKAASPKKESKTAAESQKAADTPPAK